MAQNRRKKESPPSLQTAEVQAAIRDAARQRVNNLLQNLTPQQISSWPPDVQKLVFHLAAAVGDLEHAHDGVIDALKVAHQRIATDPLTQIASLPAFSEKGDEVFTECKTYHEKQTTIIALDMDGFKLIFQAFGHKPPISNR